MPCPGTSCRQANVRVHACTKWMAHAAAATVHAALFACLLLWLQCCAASQCVHQRSETSSRRPPQDLPLSTCNRSRCSQALALLDALAGGADAFWERYAAEVLPAPLDLTLPLCFPAELLPELQHGAIIAAAQAQQQRLAALFPGLSGAMCQGAWVAGAWLSERAVWGWVPFVAHIAAATTLDTVSMHSRSLFPPPLPLPPHPPAQVAPAGCSGALPACAAAPLSCARTASALCPSWTEPTMPPIPAATSGEGCCLGTLVLVLNHALGVQPLCRRRSQTAATSCGGRGAVAGCCRLAMLAGCCPLHPQLPPPGRMMLCCLKQLSPRTPCPPRSTG